MNDLEKVLVEDSSEKPTKLKKPMRVIHKWKYQMVVAAFLVVLVGAGLLMIAWNANKKAEEKYKDKITLLEDKLAVAEDESKADIKELKDKHKKEIDQLNNKWKEKSDKDAKTIEEQAKQIKDFIDRPEVHLLVSNELESQIQQVRKLVTLEYRYTNAGKFENAKGWDSHGIFTGKSFIAQWEGTMEIGVNMEKAKVKKVDNVNKTITIQLPNAEIFSNDVDQGSYVTIDENNNIFNPISVDDIRNFDLKNEIALEQKVERSNVIQQAYTNATVILERFIKLIPSIGEQYSIIFTTN